MKDEGFFPLCPSGPLWFSKHGATALLRSTGPRRIAMPLRCRRDVPATQAALS